jgi:predicted metal-binding membrane protein
MERVLYRLADGPQLLMWLCLGVVTALAWLALVNADDLTTALCGAAPAPPLAILAMWLAMTLAMMLPTAAPMVAAYMDIAAAARAKHIATAAPAVLIAGYLAVWAAFAATMTALQLVAQSYALEPQRAGAASLILAGLYQFAPTKHACLTKCRRPMPYFLAHWSGETVQVFRMGLSQGALCLGCCWAMMLISFGLGSMNLLWMAALAAAMILEKTLPEPKPLVYGLGLGFIAAGAALAIGGMGWL